MRLFLGLALVFGSIYLLVRLLAFFVNRFVAPDKKEHFVVVHSDGYSEDFPDLPSARSYAATNGDVSQLRRVISYSLPLHKSKKSK